MCLNVQHSKFLIMTDLSQATTQLALALNCLVMLQSKNAQEKTKLCGPWTIHCHYDFTNIGYLRQYLQDVTHLSPNQFFTLQNLTNEHSDLYHFPMSWMLLALTIIAKNAMLRWGVFQVRSFIFMILALLSSCIVIEWWFRCRIIWSCGWACLAWTPIFRVQWMWCWSFQIPVHDACCQG